MLDIKFVRTNPDAVKENIKKKFQDEKIPMVDEVIEFDAKYRAAKTRCDELRAQRNKKSKEIGGLMAKGQKEEAEKIKAEVLVVPAAAIRDASAVLFRVIAALSAFVRVRPFSTMVTPETPFLTVIEPSSQLPENT